MVGKKGERGIEVTSDDRILRALNYGHGKAKKK